MVTLDVAGLELRAGEAGQPAQLVGHASVFNQWSRIADPWFGDLWDEQVAPGAFKKTIKEADVRALWNHDPNIVLGRKAAGTLTLREDEIGLAVTITPPDSEWGRPVLEAIRRGDVSGMSIGFQVVKEKWEHPDRKKDPDAVSKRTIQEVKLFDVSPVTFPAFEGTDIAARSEDWSEDDRRAFRAYRLAQEGAPMGPEERESLLWMGQMMQRYARGEPGGDTSPETGEHVAHSPTTEPDADRALHSVETWKRRLAELETRLGGSDVQLGTAAHCR
jgi:hypothetical protein